MTWIRTSAAAFGIASASCRPAESPPPTSPNEAGDADRPAEVDRDLRELVAGLTLVQPGSEVLSTPDFGTQEIVIEVHDKEDDARAVVFLHRTGERWDDADLWQSPVP